MLALLPVMRPSGHGAFGYDAVRDRRAGFGSRNRTEAAAARLWEALPTEQRDQIEVVVVDMWPAFTNSVKTNALQAEIAHDRFHISKHLNEAADQVRRQEHKN